MRSTCLLWVFFVAIWVHGQSDNYSLKGVVTAQMERISNCKVYISGQDNPLMTDTNGYYEFRGLKTGTYQVTFTKEGYKPRTELLTIKDHDAELDIRLKELIIDFSEIIITKQKDNEFGITRLRSVEGTSIYESKKTEVILPKDLALNAANNNARQIYAKIPGLNIWENDPGGMQLAIGARGLNPNRTSNFNTRQNGYDISADALGYPESYYTPPVEAIERIEVVRGAASLQYGPQFGGMINYVLNKPPKDKKLQITSRQTIGSYGLYSSFNSIGGTVKKWSYYTFYQYKRGDGWRPNSGFEAHTAYGSIAYQATEKLRFTFDYTHMSYLAKQPGGLRDPEFIADPTQSKRSRNWFKVNWNLLALDVDYAIRPTTKINSRFFANISERSALGVQNLGTGVFEAISRPDIGGERTMIQDLYDNIGNETRFIHRYRILKNMSTFLMGVRLYRGQAVTKQGNASNGSGPDFYYLNPGSLDKSYYFLPSNNSAVFIEHIFTLHPKFTVTPGFRFEHIETYAQGYYNTRTRTSAGALVADLRTNEQRTNVRNLYLLGIGSSFKPTDALEVYGNISQNYRPVTFSDIRVGIASFKVDSNIRDERGFNIDFGLRGSYKKVFNFDASIFFLNYTGRIGDGWVANTLTGQLYNLRTNIGNSEAFGFEAFGELDIWRLVAPAEQRFGLSVFANMAVNEARYYQTRFAATNGKYVEYVPFFTSKSGITFQYGDLKSTFQYTYVDRQFSDATNAVIGTDNAVAGLVPEYQVLDFSVKYKYRWLIAEGGVNNILNTIYFTRRASSYPGPGILPADPRVLYLTLGIQL